MSPTARLATILDLVSAHGNTDGAHHKQWLIDQIVRVAHGATVTQTEITRGGETEWLTVVGTCEAYEEWASDGWDPGVSP